MAHGSGPFGQTGYPSRNSCANPGTAGAPLGTIFVAFDAHTRPRSRIEALSLGAGWLRWPLRRGGSIRLAAPL